MSDSLTADDREALITEHIPETVTVEIVVQEDFGIKTTDVRCDADVDFDQLGDVADADHRVVMGRLTEIKQVVQEEVGDFDEEDIEIEGDEHVVASATVDRDSVELVEDDDDNDDDPEIVTDGGQDPSDILTVAEIEDAIERKDDIGHPDAYSVNEVRDVLARINRDIIDHWDLHQDALDEGAYEIVHEDDDVIVLAEGGHFWSEQFDAMQIGDEHGILIRIVVNLQHVAARKHCDHSWSVSTPVVVRKTGDFRAGEQNVLREIARRTDEFGSVARAVDTLATEVHGWNKGDWARLTGRNPSTVTRTTDN